MDLSLTFLSRLMRLVFRCVIILKNRPVIDGMLYNPMRPSAENTVVLRLYFRLLWVQVEKVGSVKVLGAVGSSVGFPMEL